MNLITIRKEQLQAMSLAKQQRAATGIPFNHLHECFPAETQAMGPMRVHALVSEARNKCAQYGIGDTLGLLYYLNLCMVLGANFDDQGLFSWTADVLRSGGTSAQKFEEIFRRLELDEEAD